MQEKKLNFLFSEVLIRPQKMENTYQIVMENKELMHMELKETYALIQNFNKKMKLIQINMFLSDKVICGRCGEMCDEENIIGLCDNEDYKEDEMCNGCWAKR